MAQIGQIYYRISGVGSSGIDLYTDVLAQVGASQFTKVGVQAPPGTQMVLNQLKQIMIGRTGIYELDEDIAITELYFIRPQNYIRDEAAEEAAKIEGQQGIEDAMTIRRDSYLAWTQGYAESWIDILNRLEELPILLEQDIALLAAKQAELEVLEEELKKYTEGSTEYQEVKAQIDAKEQEITSLETEIQDYTDEQKILQACADNELEMQKYEDTYLAAYTVARAKYYEGVNGIYVVGDVGDLENVIIDYIWE